MQTGTCAPVAGTVLRLIKQSVALHSMHMGWCSLWQIHLVFRSMLPDLLILSCLSR